MEATHHRDQTLLTEQNFAQKAEYANPNDRRNINATQGRNQFARWHQEGFGGNGDQVKRKFVEFRLGIPGQDNAENKEEHHHGK